MKIIWILIIIALIAGGVLAFKFLPAQEKADRIKVETPRANAIVRSPLLVKGEARGSWFFEASFPARIYDANGRELGAVPARAQSDWMTAEFVPFEARIEFPNPTTEKGVLVLEKDNPSGRPETAEELRIPVRFKL